MDAARRAHAGISSILCRAIVVAVLCSSCTSDRSRDPYWVFVPLHAEAGLSYLGDSVRFRLMHPDSRAPLSPEELLVLPMRQRQLRSVKARLLTASPGSCNPALNYLELIESLPTLSFTQDDDPESFRRRAHVPEAEVRPLAARLEALSQADLDVLYRGSHPHRVPFWRMRYDAITAPLIRASNFCDDRASTDPSYPGGETCLAFAMRIDLLAASCADAASFLPRSRDFEVGDDQRCVLGAATVPWAPGYGDAASLRAELVALLNSDLAALQSLVRRFERKEASFRRFEALDRRFRTDLEISGGGNVDSEALLDRAHDLQGRIWALSAAFAPIAEDFGCTFSLDHLRTCADDPYAPRPEAP